MKEKPMIVLKHLCREFDVEEYDLRMALREAGLKPTNRRWKWEENSKELKSAKSVAQKLKSKKHGLATLRSRQNSPTADQKAD